MLTDTDWGELTTACQDAMQQAAAKPGRYGGRYVGRYYDRKAKRTVFVVLDDDDPDLVPEAIDVLAQVTPREVMPMGRARHYLRPDGTVWFPDEAAPANQGATREDQDRQTHRWPVDH